MIHWNYSGFDRQGKARKARIKAATQEEARELLQSMGVSVVSLKRSQDIVMPWENRPPGLKDKALFTAQFAQMLGGSIPRQEALGVAARTTTNSHLRAAIEEVRKEINAGTPMEEVFAHRKFAKDFDPVFVSFIRMGVASGDIEKPLSELAEMYKWQLRILGMVKKGLTLPGIIALACIVVTYFIMARVVPTFMGILDGLNAELPPLTRAVKTVSQLAANPVFTLGLIAIIAATVFAFINYRKTPQGLYNTDKAMLRLPVLGPMLKTFTLARISRSLSVMARNGIPMHEALRISAGIASNAVYAQHLQEMREIFVGGNKMYPVMMQNEREFPEQYWLQFRAAEEKNSLPETLDYLGEIYNDEVTTQVESMTTIIEPFLMIFLGVIVGVIVVSVFLPMTTMMNALQK